MALESEHVQANGQLLSVAMTVSPTGTIQQAFSSLVNRMRWDGMSERDLTEILLKALLDGIVYGVWPTQNTR